MSKLPDLGAFKQYDMLKHVDPISAVGEHINVMAGALDKRIRALEEAHNHNPIEQLLASQAKVIELQDTELARLRSLLNEVTGPREG